jgi:hypothetical protein
MLPYELLRADLAKLRRRPLTLSRNYAACSVFRGAATIGGYACPHREPFDTVLTRKIETIHGRDKPVSVDQSSLLGEKPRPAYAVCRAALTLRRLTIPCTL